MLTVQFSEEVFSFQGVEKIHHFVFFKMVSTFYLTFAGYLRHMFKRTWQEVTLFLVFHSVHRPSVFLSKASFDDWSDDIRRLRS